MSPFQISKPNVTFFKIYKIVLCYFKKKKAMLRTIGHMDMKIYI